MRTATLTSYASSAQGTFGTLITDSRFRCFTGELQWKNNAANLSCIPAGTYQVNWRFSEERRHFCYHVDGVPNRSAVEIHAGNVVGDVTMGLKSDSKGCILTGTCIGPYNGQTAVLHSWDALNALENDLKHQPFVLTIIRLSATISGSR